MVLGFGVNELYKYEASVLRLKMPHHNIFQHDQLIMTICNFAKLYKKEVANELLLPAILGNWHT